MAATDDCVTCDAGANMARQSLYRFAALSLLDPNAGSWDRLDSLRNDPLLAEAAAWIRNLPAAEPDQLASNERPLQYLDPSHALARLPGTPGELNDEYESTFGLLVSSACPQYETEYIDSSYCFQRSNMLADVSGFYRAFGLTTSDQHPDRPDHIVLELEFMAFLLDLERQTNAFDSAVRQQRQEICRDAQVRFMEEHVAWWVAAFAKLLSRENQDGFYGSIGILLSSLIPAERAFLGVEAPIRSAEPSSLEHPEACDGCELASV